MYVCVYVYSCGTFMNTYKVSTGCNLYSVLATSLGLAKIIMHLLAIGYSPINNQESAYYSQ